MKVFTNSNTCKFLLCTSIVANIVLLIYSCRAENYGHYFRHLLEEIDTTKVDIRNRPDYWSVRGWNTTIEKLDYKCDVMFFGHSQIEMSDFRKYFPNVKIVTSGYPGDNVSGMRMRVAQIEALKPSKVFLMCGVNSLGMKDEDFKYQYNALVEEIEEASPNSKLYIFNILPECNGPLGSTSNNKKIVYRNKFIEEYTQRKNIVLIDLYSLYADKNGVLFEDVTIDGVHLNPQGYDRWADAIKQYME